MKRYTIDPAGIKLSEFRKLIADRRMLPGRVALQEQMEERFGLLEEAGIRHLGELLNTLGSKAKIERFSEGTGLTTEYLVLLKREAGSYLAKPFPLANFPGIPFEYTELLKGKGFRNTKDFFEELQSEKKLADLATLTGIPSYRLEELCCLCDLSRITGVGGIFARVVYEAGIRSVEEFARTEIQTQLRSYLAVIEKHGYPAGKLGEEDISYAISYANVLVSYNQ